MNFEEMKDWCNDAQRSLGRELDRLQEQQRTMDNHLQVLEAENRQLESERQHLETEVRANPMVNAIRCSGECRWQKHGHWRWQSVGVGRGLLQTPMRCGA